MDYLSNDQKQFIEEHLPKVEDEMPKVIIDQYQMRPI